MTIMRSSDFRAVVEPILNTGFDGIYDMRKDEWKGVFYQHDAPHNRRYFEEYVQYGFTAAPEMPDGMGVTYQSGGVLFSKRYDYKVYGLGFAMTKVLVEDGEHVNLGKQYSKHLANALLETKETVLANVINRSVTSGYTGGDGKVLAASDHPIVGGTFSNLLTTAAAFSQTSLEQMLLQIRGAVDNNGKKASITAENLVIHPDNIFQAEVVLKSTLRSGTANNDVNAIKSSGMLGGDVKVISRLTSSTAWGVTTSVNKESGLKLIMRRPLQRSMEGDFETDSMRYKATERYGYGWTDPRCFYFTPGV